MKTYEKPRTEVITLHLEGAILATSGEKNAGTIEQGGFSDQSSIFGSGK